MLDGIQIDPVAFTIPFGQGFDVYWYGIIIMIGVSLGTWWGSREIARRGESPDELLNGLLLVLVVGYFCARISYVILDILGGNGSNYETAFDWINLRAGGVNILGGFLGAFVAAYIFISWRKLKLWHFADVTGPILLLAQAIGRWGNFINQELYGPPTDKPWGILIDMNNRLPQYRSLPVDTRFHPTFLYESILLLIGFIVLVVLNNRNRDNWKPGTLFDLFLIWWGSQRVFIEFFRPDQTTIGDSIITYSMVISAFIALGGVYGLLKRSGKLGNKKSKKRVL
ncbi:MAG: prolipoprotein diacylglyceryl transferase, partial [Methylococcales bacterium]|nr:prolipoprotein diacylglyceryl transferase [Methylococcales bacterium]